MLDDNEVSSLRKAGRYLIPGAPVESALGPLQQLPGTWKSTGLGWNLIALPFAAGPFGYRLLLNQYNETLTFELVDKAVPNRGVGGGIQTDQFVVTIDYLQTIKQVAAVDEPVSGEAGGPDLAIHHEPGLWLHMANETTDGIDIARLASIPHGDSVLALGRSETVTGAAQIPDTSGLPIGVPQDLSIPYLEPYRIFDTNPFKGTVAAPGFPGFNPAHPNELLKLANEGVDIVKTTVLNVDSTIEQASVANIPFIVRQANAASMNSTFWIQELADGTLRLQYTQAVILDFFDRVDGLPGRIGWPHVSINTLMKV